MNLKDLIGIWNGTTAEDAFLHYTEIEICSTSDGKDKLCLILRDRQYEEFPKSKLQWKDARTFTCNLPHQSVSEGITLRGVLESGSRALSLTIMGSIFDIENYQVELRLDDGRYRRYQRAADSLNYQYRVPTIHKGNDYFKPDDAAHHGLNTDDISTMVNKLLRLNSGTKNDAQVDAILILKDGNLLLEEYFWGMSMEDHHEISSCTKSIVSLLFGIAWDQGLIDLEEPVTDIFPEISSDWGANEPVRVKHVLSMTTGTRNDLGLNGLDEKLLRSDKMAEMILGIDRVAIPGSKYDYDNKIPFLAGLILERKTGSNVEQFARKYLFKPLLVADARWTYTENQKAIDGTRFVFTSGAMFLPLRDFAKLGQLVLNRGMYHGKRVVSEKWLDLSTTQHTVAGQWPYGFYWHLNTPDQRHLHNFDGILALGQGEQVCAVIPELNMVIAWMSSTWVNNFGYRVGMKVIDDQFVSKIARH